ncbi:MAG: hypothetical protein CL610_21940 [Anaerolineaceae bacterium]|nr:hypothetical protein [Anaerolineaceae bacterium]
MLRKILLIFCSMALLSMGFAAAQEDTSEALDVLEYTLDNGLEVLLVEDHSAPTVAINVWYHVGGANDPEGRSGFAHLFEHMMFEETAHIETGEIDRLITSAGGSLNAYTDTDVTVYYEILPSHQLPLGLWLEADRMASLAVNQANFDNQRAVVIEEYKLRVGNAPYGEALQTLFTRPFDYEPYQKRTIGSIEDLNNATVEDVRNFHSTYYLPNNATLVVAGDIDFEQTQTLIDSYFVGIPAGDEPPMLPDFDLAQQAEAEVITIEDGLANLPATLIGYETPPRIDEDYAALELLARILSAGNSSRLAVSLLDTGMAVQADTILFGQRGPSLFGVLLVPNATVPPEDVEQVFYDELDRIREEGVRADELEKAINGIRSERILGLESAFNLAESVQAANYYFDDPQAVFGEINRFEEVTSEDIQRVLDAYLAPEDRHVINVVPSDAVPAADAEPVVGGTEAESDEPVEYDYVIDQDTPPEPLPITEFTLPPITEITLDNGLEVIVVEQPSIPIISLDLFQPGGESAAPADLAGLASITGGLLTRGTETRSAQDIASTIEQVGGGMGSESRTDALAAGVFALSEDTELAFELLGDVVLNPTFPEEELEILREASLTSLEFALADPAAQAGRTFGRLLYGAHPYGNTATPETVQAVTRQDVIDFYESQNNPDGAFLIVAGDITADRALELAEATFGDWESSGEAQVIEFPELEARAESEIFLVDRPGSSQAQFIIGNLGPVGNTDDLYAIRVMNEIFGGNFSSRLSQNIREDKGYTYGIYSSFSLPADRGVFRISAAVRNEVAGAALEEILSEIDRIQTEDVPADELNDVTSGMVGRFALGLETYQQFVDQIAAFKLRGVPISALEDYPESVAGIDQAAVMDAAQAYIQPDQFLIVVVGDASVLEPQLADIAPVTVVEAE